MIFLESTVIVCLSIQFIFAPSFSKISHDIFTSLIFGKFSIVHVPSIKSVAGSIATAAFYAPFIITSPFNGVGPVTTNFSNKITSVYA